MLLDTHVPTCSRVAVEWTADASSWQSAAVSPRGAACSLVTGRTRYAAQAPGTRGLAELSFDIKQDNRQSNIDHACKDGCQNVVCSVPGGLSRKLD